MRNVYIKITFTSWWGLFDNVFLVVIPKSINFQDALRAIENYIEEEYSLISDRTYDKCLYMGDDYLFFEVYQDKKTIMSEIPRDIMQVVIEDDCDRDNYKEASNDYTC